MLPLAYMTLSSMRCSIFHTTRLLKEVVQDSSADSLRVYVSGQQTKLVVVLFQ